MKLFIIAGALLFSFVSQACLVEGLKGHSISAVVGDWGGDGHEKTEKYEFCSSLPRKEVSKAYKKGVEKIGFNLVDDVAVDYEDNKLSAEFLAKLVKSGFDKSDLAEYDGEVSLHKDDYFKIWTYFIKVGNPDFKYVKAKSYSIDIGGYGLFY